MDASQGATLVGGSFLIVQTHVNPLDGGPPTIKGDGVQPSYLVSFTSVARCSLFKKSHFRLSHRKWPMQDERQNVKPMLFEMLDVRVFVLDMAVLTLVHTRHQLSLRRSQCEWHQRQLKNDISIKLWRKKI